MRFLCLATVLAATTVCGAAAAAPSLWVQCDGLPKPESLAKQTAKAGLTILTGGFYGLTIEGGGEPAGGEQGVSACTQALADPVLEPFWERRVSLLRSKALHEVEAGRPDVGLKDLEATRAAAGGHVDALAFNRSLGVSTKLFEASLLAKQGRTAEAERLAIEAADARPWSARIQRLSSAILAIDPTYGPDEERVLTRLARLDPDGLAARAAAREWGDPTGAADDWAAEAKAMRRLEPNGEFVPETFEYTLGSAVRLPLPLAKAALSAARAGRIDQAKALLAELDGLKPWAPEVMPKNKFQAARATSTMKVSALMIERAAPYRKATQAWLLAHEGKFQEAQDMIDGLPAEPATFELARATAKGLGRPEAPALAGRDGLIKSLREGRAERLVVLDYARSLPLLEETEPSRQRAGKPMSGLPGRDSKLKTGEISVRVEGYRGMAAAEEQALLRAAQVARTAGAKGFVLTERRDFEKFYVSAYAPRPTENTPNPQMVETITELVLLNPDAPPAYAERAGLAIDAEQVWTELSPFYVLPAEVK